MDFTIKFSKNDIADIEYFIDNYLINAMNNSGMSMPAMAMVLQTIVEKKDELKNILESGEDNE